MFITMDRKRTRDLVKQHVESWETQDRAQFLETLHNEVVVRECYGPVDDGEGNLRGNGTVRGAVTAIRYSDKFDFLFDGDATMVAFERLANREAHAFFGSSQVTFWDGRIYSIDEYERTKG